MNGSREVIVLGATGYVGGRLVSKLLEAGNKVRVLTRSTGRAERYEWSDRVQMFTGDVLEPDTLAPALEGCDAAYYLVHSIGTGGDFAATEATAARNVRDAADAAGLRRIVYLGGMGSGDDLSKHLASRHRVGEILASGRTATTELRGGRDHRIRIDLVRDAAVPHRGAARDGDPAMGPYEMPADRDQ